MPAKTPYRARIGFCVLAALLTLVTAAEPAHPLMGATRDQVLQKLGGPKSQLESGSRTVLLYQNERIVLRDNLVVDVESIASGSSRPLPVPLPVPVAEAIAPVVVGSPALPSEPVSAATLPTVPVAPVGTAANLGAASEPKVEIKLVRPPSANYARPPNSQAETTPSLNPVAAAPAPAPVPVVAAAEPVPPVPILKSAGESSVQVVSAPIPEPARKRADEVAAEQANAEKMAAEKTVKEMTAKASEAARRRLKDANAQGPDESPVSLNLMLGFAALAVGGVGFVVWRWRQRQFELSATSVQNTPVTPGAGAASLSAGSTFSEDYIRRLDAGRFEVLVLAYFNKTGVVASRARARPGAVTQIRISWKGEPKPFAGVFCLPDPAGPIEGKALSLLVAELEADQIRRGQVVSTGHFSAAAKQYAAEKHLTLLAGDSLLEKLNALPESARKDIHQSVVAGENALPT